MKFKTEIRWLVTALFDGWRLDNGRVGAKTIIEAKLKFRKKYKKEHQSKLTNLVAKPIY